MSLTSLLSRLGRAVASGALGLALFAGPAFAEVTCGGTSLFDKPDGADLAKAVDAASETVNPGPTFWKIEVPGRKVPPSWLLGTIHLTDARVTTLPKAVDTALDKARILAVENVTSLNPKPEGKDLQVMVPLTMYTDGRTLKDGLAQADVDDLLKALNARGLPGWAFLGWRPWAVVISALAYPPCEMKRMTGGARFLDGQLLDRVKASGRPVASLEEMSEQLGALAAMPEDLQFALLKVSLKTEHLQVDMNETMLQLYLKGEIGRLIGLSKVMLARYDPEHDYAPFWRQALEVRNVKMRDHALPLIREGNAFLAIGAGHLIGKDGLVALLRKEGFSVEPVR